MSVLSKIAYHQGIRSDEPNQLLARELAEANDREGIRELASNLFCKDKNIQSDYIDLIKEWVYTDIGQRSSK